MKNSLNEKPELSALVVDDEPSVLRVVVRLLNRLGFSEVHSATDRIAAENLLKEISSVRGKLDFVLTDNNMPPSGGDEGLLLARKIQNNDFEGVSPAVLVASGKFPPGINTTPDGITMLEKPFTVNELKAALVGLGVFEDES